MNIESPKVNLIVMRSTDIDRAVSFYQRIGFIFTLHSHGKGPEHYSSEENGFVFEIYPARSDDDLTLNTRIGISVDSVDTAIEALAELEIEIISAPKDTQWGRRAVVRDLDGHTVELLATETPDD